MLKIAKLAAIAAASAMLAAPAFAQDKAAAKVNDVAIPQTRIDVQVADAVNQGMPDSPQVRANILSQTVTLEVLSQEAVKKGLDKQPDVADKVTQEMELARQSVLAKALVKDYMNNHPVSEDALKKEYDGIKADPRMTQYKIAHIVVKTEKEAKVIAAKLKKGGDFAALAKEKSLDQASAEQGGELGWLTANGLPPDFAKAMTELKKKGQISAPVEAGGAWHVLKLLDTRVMPFEEAKPMLMRPLQQDEVQKLIADLRSKAKIEEVK